MSLTTDDVKKIADLAKLEFSPENIEQFTQQLTRILTFVEQMNTVNTTDIEPMAHPMDLPQRLRPDVVTEKNERDEFQAIAPEVKAGLYIVPKFIEEA